MSGLRRWLGPSLLGVLLVAAVIARLLVGRGAEGPTWGWPEEPGVLWFRVTALTACLIAGSSLGVSGLLLQSLLRNPLASPFILGLSAGAGLGLSIATWAAVVSPGLAWLLDAGALLPATAGALICLLFVAALGRRSGVIEPLTLVLAGVIVSSLAGALTLLVQQLLPFEARGRIAAWLLGRVPEVPVPFVTWVSAAATVVGIAGAVRLARALDAASLSDAEAVSVGVALPRLRLLLLADAALLAAAATVLCGPLAFVGLIGPHAARLVCGARHGGLVIGSALAGSLLLVGADAARQAIDVGTGRLPIGVLTAVLGGVAFLWLLRRRPGWTA